jgi:hypothetical protein
MFIRILKLSATGMLTGRAHGHRVPRNPLAWLPMLLAMTVAAPILLILFLLFLISLPILALTGGIAWLTLGSKKRRAFAEQAERGNPFAKFEGGPPILEAEVVREGYRERSGARDGG